MATTPAHLAVSSTTSRSPWVHQLEWFAVGAVAAFLVPFVFASLLEMHHDVYLGVYFAFVICLIGVYARQNSVDLRAVALRNWRWGLAAGVLFGIPVVSNVFTETETARPGGLYFAFELVWRGATYGAIDAVLLTVFPCMLVYKALGGPLTNWRKRLAYFGASLALVMIITASYHLGYSQYRDDGVGEPELGNTLISMPMLLTANPLGSIIDHSGMHIAAVIHAYEGDRIPPQTEAE